MTDDEKEDVPYTKIGRRFTEIEIRELSVVSVPANPDTLFTMKRAFKKFFNEYETRSVAMEERVILSDSENPFVKKPVIEEVIAPEVETEVETEVENIEEITPETA